MVKNIKKVVVYYEDDETEEFTGSGTIRRTHTTKGVEDPITRKVTDEEVSFITIGMPLDEQAK